MSEHMIRLTIEDADKITHVLDFVDLGDLGWWLDSNGLDVSGADRQAGIRIINIGLVRNRKRPALPNAVRTSERQP